MKTRVIEFGGVKGIAIDPEGMNPGEAVAKILSEAFGIDTEKDEDEESNKELHDRFVKTMLHMKELAAKKGKTVQECINEINEKDNDDDIDDCYCPSCTAKAVSLLTKAEIIEIGAKDVSAVLEDVYQKLTAKVNKHLRVIEEKCAFANRIVREHAVTQKEAKQDKPYEDMSREELIAELNKRGK